MTRAFLSNEFDFANAEIFVKSPAKLIYQSHADAGIKFRPLCNTTQRIFTSVLSFQEKDAFAQHLPFSEGFFVLQGKLRRRETFGKGVL